MSASSSTNAVLGFGPVPPGQRWIIEHVSGEFEGGDIVEFTLHGNAPEGWDVFIPQKTSTSHFVTNSQTKFIVDPGQSVTFSVAGSIAATHSIAGFISGVIVPAPQ